jgi:DNA-binding beta-propeller fold protein YncE
MRTTHLLVLLLATGAASRAASPLLLVLEKDDRTLAVVDTGSLKIVGRAPAGDDPHEVVTSDDGKLAYISNYGGFISPKHTLSVVDLTERKALPTVDLGALIAPHGLDMVGGKIYFTAEGSKTIGRYDPSSGKVDWLLGIGRNRTHMLIVSKDLDRIFTSNVNSDSVSILERDTKADASGWTQFEVAVGKGPEGFDVSPNGKELWAANSHDGTVCIVDITAKKVVKTLNVGMRFSNRLKFTPDGKLVLISDLGTGDLLVLDAASQTDVKRMSLGRGAAGILMAPDGSRAYVAVSRDNYVAVINLLTLTPAGRIATGRGPDGMAWAQQAQ